MSRLDATVVGVVQGVGFRYTVHRIAASLGLRGWVRNFRDGRVEIMVEGTKEQIEKFTKEIADHFGSYIRGKEISFSNSSGQFKDFQIIA